MEILNPTLYNLLKARFKSVKVSNQGVAQVSQYCKRILGDDHEDYLDIVEPGEYYQVCCPFCNDTRHRLYLNHMWGKLDKHFKRNLWMAICYNENCLVDFDRRMQLWEDLVDPDAPALDHARIVAGKEIDLDDVKMSWPGPVTRVDKLPKNHDAVQYLLSRSFDPERIGRFYNVHYCHTSWRYLAQGRLIIPIYDQKRFVGWQARYVGEIDWSRDGAPPKYYTCPGTPRRKIIYNFGNARQYKVCVVVEGPMDVWGVGPMGVGTLGATMTPFQKRMIFQAFKDYAVVSLYDPDKAGQHGAKKIAEAFEGQLAGGYANVTLPPGRDPGNMDRAFMREYITSEARAQGVKISWSKR